MRLQLFLARMVFCNTIITVVQNTAKSQLEHSRSLLTESAVERSCLLSKSDEKSHTASA
jgi:hypothetical protein